MLPDTALKPEPVPSGTVQGKVLHLSHETNEDPGTLLKALPFKDNSFLQAFGCRVGNNVEVVARLSAEAPRRTRAALASSLIYSKIAPRISAFKTINGPGGTAKTFDRAKKFLEDHEGLAGSFAVSSAVSSVASS